MKISEMQNRLNHNKLLEEPVDSSWIADIDAEYQDDGTLLVIMTTLDGREYELPGIDKKTYREWLKAPSKGRFWWSRIRDLVT